MFLVVHADGVILRTRRAHAVALHYQLADQGPHARGVGKGPAFSISTSRSISVVDSTYDAYEPDRSIDRACQLVPWVTLTLITMADTLRRMGHPEACVGQDTNRLVAIPVGYRVCFSWEEQLTPEKVIVPCRHISISVGGRRGAIPHPVAIEAIMKRFGFTGTLGTAIAVYLEGEEWEHPAVNVLEPISKGSTPSPPRP